VAIAMHCNLKTAWRRSSRSVASGLWEACNYKFNTSSTSFIYIRRSRFSFKCEYFDDW